MVGMEEVTLEAMEVQAAAATNQRRAPFQPPPTQGQYPNPRQIPGVQRSNHPQATAESTKPTTAKAARVEETGSTGSKSR